MTHICVQSTPPGMVDGSWSTALAPDTKIRSWTTYGREFLRHPGTLDQDMDFDGEKSTGNHFSCTLCAVGRDQIREVNGYGNADRSLIDGSATFEVPDDWDYVYLEVEDDEGRVAWTNPLFKAIRRGFNGR